MQQTTPIWNSASHLFLLIGENTLPNYVVARLLATPEASIYLLHTVQTINYAKFLKQMLEDKQTVGIVRLREISADDGNEIFAAIEKILSEYKVPFDTQVHLNYTGGTKPMSVHVHRAFCLLRPKAIRSYLSANSLKLYIDDIAQPEYPGMRAKITFNEMAGLHGYVIDSYASDKYTPATQVLAYTIAQIHGSTGSLSAWRKWVNSIERGKITILPETSDPFLGQFRIAANNVCEGNATAEGLARLFGFQELISVRKWFIGEWLEYLVFFAVQRFASTSNFSQFGAAIHPKPTIQVTEERKFDLDVAAIVGYQLFSFSCIVSDEITDTYNSVGAETQLEFETDSKKALKMLRKAAKGHLFEALIRSQQLGGEEARTALVGIFSEPLSLQKELEREWSIRKNGVRVFGQADLLKLDDLIPDWIDETLKSQKGR